ncbi:MAG: AI-2E family transporter [Candidatus Promineifilaceae bacterium]|nr:AI-2E family transporter [Candidatus Promineifilaceae bacterium]
MQRLAAYTGVVLATAFGVYLLLQFHQVLALFALSLLLAAALRPVHQALASRGLPPTVGLPLIYAVVLLAIAALVFLGGRQLVNELQELAGVLAEAYDDAYTTWTEESSAEQFLASQLPSSDIVLQTVAGSERGNLFSGVASLTGGLLSAAGAIATIMIISVYWTADRTHFERIWLLLLPANRRAEARHIWRAVEDQLGAYLRSELLQSGLAALLLGLGYWLIGLPFASVLALVGALAWLIPLVGPVLILTSLVLIGMSTNQPWLAAGAGIYTLAVLLLLEYIVEPRLVKDRTGSAMLSLILMLGLIQELGLLGLILGPPLAALLQRLFVELLLKRSRTSIRANQADERLSSLRQRLVTVAASIDSQDQDDLGAHYASLGQRLDDLIEQTAKAFQIELRSADDSARPAMDPVADS